MVKKFLLPIDCHPGNELISISVSSWGGGAYVTFSITTYEHNFINMYFYKWDKGLTFPNFLKQRKYSDVNRYASCVLDAVNPKGCRSELTINVARGRTLFFPPMPHSPHIFNFNFNKATNLVLIK